MYVDYFSYVCVCDGTSVILLHSGYVEFFLNIMLNQCLRFLSDFIMK